MKISARPLKTDRAGRCSCWRLYWELPPGPDAKRKQETETFHGSRKAAEEHWRNRQAEIDKGAGGRPSDKLLTGTYVEQWARTKINLKPSTQHSYQEVITHHVAPYIGHLPLTELSPEHLRRLYADLLERGRKSKQNPGTALSPRRVRYVHSILHAALAQAVREEKLLRNVADLVTPPKAAPKQAAAFTLAQCQELMRALGDHRLVPAFLLAWTLGLRRGELLGLHWRQIDLERGVLYVQANLVELDGHLLLSLEPKTEKGRRGLILPNALVAALKDHRANQEVERALAGPAWEENDLVFCTAHGKLLRPSNFDRLYRSARDKAKLPKLQLHALRHTAATLLLQAGVPLPVVSEQLGHADYAFTKNTYGHLQPELQSLSAQALDALLDPDHPGLV